VTERPLTKLEEELLADLYEIEEAFLAGRLKGATIRSQVLYRMASRRGKTLPAPVHGKVQTESAFAGVFTRTVNRLVSRKLVRQRSIRGDFSGLPYQWGFAAHGRRSKDIFLTDEGRRLAGELFQTRLKMAEQPDEKPEPSEPAEPAAGSRPPAVRTRRRVRQPVAMVPGTGVGYLFLPARKKDERARVTHTHRVKFANHTVTYLYIRKD